MLILCSCMFVVVFVWEWLMDDWLVSKECKHVYCWGQECHHRQWATSPWNLVAGCVCCVVALPELGGQPLNLGMNFFFFWNKNIVGMQFAEAGSPTVLVPWDQRIDGFAWRSTCWPAHQDHYWYIWSLGGLWPPLIGIAMGERKKSWLWPVASKRELGTHLCVCLSTQPSNANDPCRSMDQLWSLFLKPCGAGVEIDYWLNWD